MYIYESEGAVDQGSMRRKRDELRTAFPGLNFGKDNEMIVNHIVGYSGWQYDGNRRITIYPHANIAVLDSRMDDEAANRLRALGYHLPESKARIGERAKYKVIFTNGVADDVVKISEPVGEITPDEVLWRELKSGYGEAAIRRNLGKLLSHIFIPGVQEYEFGIYKVVYATSDDESYVRFKDLFRLRPDIVVDILTEKLRSAGVHDTVALSSRVQTTEGERHIPMIDIRENCFTDELLERIGAPRQVLVFTGKSFHHYDTTRLLTQEKFEAYMQLLSGQPEVGKTWPELQIEQGFALLRITPSASKPFYPEVVE